MKPSGQPRLGPAKVGGVSGGMILTGAVVIFATVMFPPLGAFVGLVVGLVLLVKASNAKHRRRAERNHRARMDAFYREQEWRGRTFTNPGWQV